jgi:krueppel-like factor 6/7
MDVLPSGNIFRELQDIHDTGYFSAQPSLEDHWQQVGQLRLCCIWFPRKSELKWYTVDFSCPFFDTKSYFQ